MTADEDARPGTGHGARWTTASIVLVAAVLAYFTRIGADCLWLVALGDEIRAHGSVPPGIPFAAADTSDWANVPVLAELVLSFVHDLGTPALPVLQVVAASTALVVLALGARDHGASDAAVARVLPVLAVGAVSGLAIVRLQLFSLIPFALLFWLLRAQHRRPTRAIWLLPPLIAVWTNLHGAVLLGVAVAGAYLLFSRLARRPLETVAVGVLSVLAVSVTPAGIRTANYYLGVLGNEAARQGTGLWARPSPGNLFDVLLVLAAIALVVLAARSGLPLWEWVVLAGLAIATVGAARNGLWLLMWAAAPAATPAAARPGPRDPGTDRPRRASVALVLAVSAAVSLAIVLARGSTVDVEDPDEVRAIAQDAGDRVVLAPEPLAEALAVEGVRLWVMDPIDAFEPADQRAYIRYIDDGDPSAALPEVDVVVARDGSEGDDRMAEVQAFALLATHGDWVVYARR